MINSSGFSSDYIVKKNLKVPVWVCPLFNELSADMADVCGEKERWTKAQPYISHYQRMEDYWIKDLRIFLEAKFYDLRRN